MLKRFVKKLPVYHQTETQKHFFAATFDQLFNPANVETIQGYLGRIRGGSYNRELDIYVDEPTKNRRNYQLEPIAYTKDITTLVDENHVFYEDLLNKLRFYGGNTLNHDRLFSDIYYSFAPPIDVDKFVNYTNYVWIEDGLPPVFFSFNGPSAQFDAEIASKIIGQTHFNTDMVTGMSPTGFEFSSGLRVVFEGSTDYPGYYTIEGVGQSIRLVRDETTQVPGGIAGSTPWDFGGIEEWDMAPWDAAEVQLVAPQKDHITIERGTCDGNAWSRTNRWYHQDVITQVQEVGQIIGATLIDGGAGYVVGDNLLVEGDGFGGVVQVTAVDGSGTITDFIILHRGQGYNNAFIDDTGAVPLPGGIPWDQFPGGDGSSWDAFDWDMDLVPSSGTDAIFEIELASAIDRRNRGERPILEFKRHIELRNHGTRFLGQVDLVASTETLADIIGQSSYTLDGIPLYNGALIIFLNPSTIPSFLPWDEDPDAGPGSMTYWDSGAWDVQGVPGSITRYAWRVSGVGTSIDLERVDIRTGAIDPPAALLGDGVLVRSGFTYAGHPFYQAEDPLLGQTWKQGQTKVRPNTHPLFQLYDYQGIPLDDPMEYPQSTFDGNEVFSYRIYQGEELGANEFANFDRVLNFQTIRKNLGQITDIIFENDLETVRTSYRPTGTSLTEVAGYYFYRRLEYNDACLVTDGEFLTNWQESSAPERQRVIDQFITVDSQERLFTLSAEPYNNDVYVKVNGVRLGDDQFVYRAAGNAVEILTPVPSGTMVEAFTYTHGPITDQDFGFFEIPSGLEKNPNNLEIRNQSWNDFVRHFVSIIEHQQPFFGTAFGVSNNYRDSAKDNSLGRFILQNQAPLLKTMLMLSNDELDLVEAIRLSGREYTRYKNKFLKVALQLITEGYTPFNEGDPIPVNQWVDEIIRRILQTREFPRAFEDTHMVAWTNVYEEEQLMGNNIATTLTVTTFLDLTDKRNAMYIYKDGVLLLADVDYEVVNLNPITIRFSTPPLIGENVIVRLYENVAPAHVPATPTKLGTTMVHRPRIEVDTSYRVPTEVIVGHDGSRTPTFSDYRDDLLLELEKRIYNGILSKFRGEYEPAVRIEDIEPTVFRETRWQRDEYETILRQSFFKWAMVMKADHRVHDSFDQGDEWTWNYSSLIGPTGEPLPGYWRGIFDQYYGTQTPHLTPWEMLGFAHRPDWWVTAPADGDTFVGYGPGPWPSNHPMWQDLEAGIIRRGPRAGADERFARPGLSSHIPVDGMGALKATPLQCIGYVGPLPTLDQASAEWAYGDLAPVEYAWRTSEAYPFAVAELLFITRPATYGEKMWNPENFLVTPANDQQIVSLRDGILKRVGNSIQTVHGEVRNGQVVLNTGYQVWVSSRLKMLGLDVGREFGDKVRGLDVKLGHKMAGFTDQSNLRLFVDGISTTATATSLLLPVENVDVRLFTGAPVGNYFYGGVVVKRTETGTYRIYGYDVLKNSFTYYERKSSPEDRAINIAGQPAPFTNYEAGRTYTEGTIIRLNGLFYRARVTHSSERFVPDNWERIPSLPVRGGVNVTYRPRSSGILKTIDYGHEFANPQEVFDFFIGWGDYLAQEGWLFENFNEETNSLDNWLNAGKEFLFWVSTNWTDGSAIAISPCADVADLVVKEGYPTSVERLTNGVYSILDRGGMAIDPINTKVFREDRRIQVVPLLEGQGIYSLRVNTTETESIVTIDNTTEFDDVVYDPLLGSRQDRILINGTRTKDWTGKLEAAGYIITGNRVLPNLENIVDSVRDYHNTEATIDDPNIEIVSKHLTGYTERDYLTQLQVFDDAQFSFYHGAIRQKGTAQSIDKLERSRIVTDLEDTLVVHEEWALKVGEFGGTENQQMVEFLLPANTIKVDPQLVELVYPQSKALGGSVKKIEIVSSGTVWLAPPVVTIQPHPADPFGGGASATATLNDDGTLREVTVTAAGGGYRLPPRVSIGPILPTPLSDRASAILEFEITPDVAGDDIITIDIDDHESWVTKPRGIAASTDHDLWPKTEAQQWNTPNAGYVHFDDITHTVFDIKNLQSLWDRPSPPVVADRIWTAKAENRDWAVYKMIESSEVIRQFHASDSLEYSLNEVTAFEITDAGTGYVVGEEFELLALPGLRQSVIIRVTEVDTLGEILDLEIVSGGLFYDTTLNFPISFGAGGAIIEFTEMAPVFYEEGMVLLTAPLPEADTNSLRYLRGKVLIQNTVYEYEQIVEDIYRLRINGEVLEDGELNDQDAFANLTAHTFYNLRFRDLDELNAERDEITDEFEVIGNDPEDKVWLDSNARSAVYQIMGIEAGQILAGFVILDGGHGYEEDGEFDVVYGGGTGGRIAYTVNPATKTIVSMTLVSSGSGYPSNVFPPDPPIFDIVLSAPAPNRGDGQWRVERVQGTDLVLHRIQETMIDTSKFEGAFVYDVTTKDTLVQLPVYDPFKGIIPSIADKNIRYKAAQDPARYTNASELRLINQALAFGEKQVGQLWWDTSTCAYVWYEQDDDLYRRDHWGMFFPGSVVDVYEWTRSSRPPEEWQGEGTVRNITDYVERREWDPLLEEVRTFFYFWVRNVPSDPGTGGRTRSASEVARLIRNPSAQLYRWYAPISQTGFVFSGVDGVFTDSDNIFQINYIRTEDENRRHVEWELGSEFDRGYRVHDKLWNKLVDSLVGFTEPVPINSSTISGFPPLNNYNDAIPVAGSTSLGYLPVPDPALSDLNRVGSRYRPRQSMVRNRSAALRVLVEVINRLVYDLMIYDQHPFWNNGLPSNNLWRWADWYAEGYNELNITPSKQVSILGALNSLTPVPGEIVKVANAQQSSFHVYNFEEERWEMIAKRAVRLEMTERIYTRPRNLQDSLELRGILDALYNQIFTGTLTGLRNELFFAMINYIVHEQEDLDWVFKTTYVALEQTGKHISTDRVFQADPFDNVMQYIQEFKPYQTKIREYRITRTTEVDDLFGTAVERDRNLSIRMFFDRFRCSLSLVEARIAKAEGKKSIGYDGYSTLDNGATPVRLGAAGRFVVQQTDLLDRIYDVVGGDSLADYMPVNAYWDTVEWDTEMWDGAASTSQNELEAVAEINRRLHEEFRCYFEGLLINNIDLSGTSTTQPWDSVPWDVVGWDANEEDTSIGTLEGTYDPFFADVDPEEVFVANGTQREFNLSTITPTYFMFVQVVDEDGLVIESPQIAGQPYTLNVDYFFIAGRVVFIQPPPAGSTINVYTYIEAGDFLNPQVHAGITEEMLPLDPRENLVIVADTVDDPETPTESYSFRIHYDSQRQVTYMRNAEVAMTTTAAPVAQNDHTIAVDDVSVLADASYENPQVAWICMERIVYHGKDTAQNLLLGVQRGTNGTPRVPHGANCKVFGFDGHEIPKAAAEQFWISPGATNVYNGAAGQWRDNANGTAIFSDTAANTFAANVDEGDALRITSGVLAGSHLVRDLIPVGSLSIVTITVSGSGYAVGDTIDVAGNGVAIVGAVGPSGEVTAVTILDHGSGYGAGPETMTSTAGDGTFEATVVTNRQAMVLAHPAPRWSGSGRIVEVDGFGWQVDTANAGGFLASTAAPAVFVRAEEGDALPCCGGP